MKHLLHSALHGQAVCLPPVGSQQFEDVVRRLARTPSDRLDMGEGAFLQTTVGEKSARAIVMALIEQEW